MPETIETPRLVLRPMREDDLAGLLTVFGDPRVMAAFGVAPFEEPQMRAWIERNLAHQARHGYGLYTVILKRSGDVIGDCGLEHMGDDLRVAELGYDFRTDYWGQGLATEAAAAVRDHALSDLGLIRLFSLIRQGNHASRRVAEKIGMALERRADRDGTPYWIYALDIGRLAQRSVGPDTTA